MEREKPLTSAYQRRVEAAFALWSSAHVNGTQGAFADEVSGMARRSFSSNSVLGWLRGAIPRDLESMDAVADALMVPAGWLYFGEPSDDPVVEVVRMQRRVLDLKEHPQQDRAEIARLEYEIVAAHVQAMMTAGPRLPPPEDEFTRAPLPTKSPKTEATRTEARELQDARGRRPSTPRTLPESKVETKKPPSGRRKGVG